MAPQRPPSREPASPNANPLERVPLHLVLLFVLGLMLAGPVVFFSFLLGGSTVGFTALAVCAVVFVSIYITGLRSASK